MEVLSNDQCKLDIHEFEGYKYDSRTQFLLSNCKSGSLSKLRLYHRKAESMFFVSIGTIYWAIPLDQFSIKKNFCKKKITESERENCLKKNYREFNFDEKNYRRKWEFW